MAISVCCEGFADELDAEKAIAEIALAGMRAAGLAE